MCCPMELARSFCHWLMLKSVALPCEVRVLPVGDWSVTCMASALSAEMLSGAMSGGIVTSA